jgi:hypothetical protein
MVQIARPFTDTTVTGWTTVGGASVNLVGEIKEETRNDSERIVSVLDPAAAVYVCRLSSFTLPTTKTGWVLDYAYRKDAAGDDNIDLTVQLRQGYVSEGTPGTLIASATHAAIPATFTVGALALSEAEATAVTDAAALSVRFVASTAV